MVQVKEIPVEGEYADDEIWLTEDEDEKFFGKGKYNPEEEYEETYFDRLKALEYMVPFSIRKRIEEFTSSLFNITLTASKIAARITWSLATSTLLLAIPTMIAYDSESFWNQIEAEQKMQGGAVPPPSQGQSAPVPLPK